MDLLLTIVGGAVGAAVVTGIFGLLKWGLERKAVKEDRRDEKEEKNVEQRDAEFEEIHQGLTNLTVAVRTQMYGQIKRDGKSYLERGYITAEELEDLISAHQVYHNVLKGNGFLDSLMEKVKQLPVK